jgi:drug/metabolite transporter (DMT)-like permease
VPRPRPPLLLPALGLNVLIASGTFLVAKQTLHDFPPLVLSLFRFVVAAGVLWPMTRLMRPGERVAATDRGRIVWLGVLAVPLNQGLFLFGMQWASASHAALLYALTPAFVLLFERLSPRAVAVSRAQIAGLALAFLGVLSLLIQRGLHFDRHSLRGDLLILLAVVAWALYLFAGRDVSRRYGSLVVTSDALLAGALIFLPIGLIALRGFEPSRVTAAGWWGLAYLALLTSALNYVIWFWGLAYLKPATVALLTNVQPLVTVALAAALLHEPVPAGFALSTGLVLAGVWLAQSGRFRTTSPASA